jgi:hypothetical protein
VKPKLLSESEVRTQAIRVRSAAIKLRDVARSVRICANSFDDNFSLSVMSALLDARMRLRLFTVKRKGQFGPRARQGHGARRVRFPRTSEKSSSSCLYGLLIASLEEFIVVIAHRSLSVGTLSYNSAEPAGSSAHQKTILISRVTSSSSDWMSAVPKKPMTAIMHRRTLMDLGRAL